MLSLIRWICSLPLALTICIFGIFGNIISIYIWRQVINKRLLSNPSTALYLIALSVCGMGLLFFFILTDSMPTKYPDLLAMHTYAVFLIWFAFPMVKVFVYACIWFTVAVSLNRMVLMYFPTFGRSIYTTTKTGISIGVIFMTCVALNVPVCFRLKATSFGANGTYAISTSEFGSTPAFKVYDHYFMCIIIVVIPWLSIALFNTMVFVSMRKRTIQVGVRLTRDELRHVKQEGNITSMLLWSTLSFLLLIAWQCITQCMFDFHDKQEGEHHKHQQHPPLYRPSHHHHNGGSYTTNPTPPHHDGTGNEYTTNLNIATEFSKLGILLYASLSCLIYGLRGTVFRREISHSIYYAILRPDVVMKQKNDDDDA